MSNLTTNNSIILLSFTGLYKTPITMQGFSADDIFGIADIKNKETSMGIDGHLSAGMKKVPIVQTFHFQADSPSLLILDTVIEAEDIPGGSPIQVQGNITLLGLGLNYQMNNGWITSYTPISPAGQIQKPRAFEITWESKSRTSLGT